MIKIVLTAAGRGTRLLPFTKEMPKEMMPIFTKTHFNISSSISKFKNYCKNYTNNYRIPQSTNSNHYNNELLHKKSIKMADLI